MTIRCGADGCYGYRYVDAYWSEPGRIAYLLRVGGELAGLALVRQVGAVMRVCEFLVLPKFRRTRVGIRAAREPFHTHPSRWQVSQVRGNDRATAFWRSVIPTPFDELVDKDGTVTQTFLV